MKWKNFNTDKKLKGKELITHIHFDENEIGQFDVEHIPVPVSVNKLLEFGFKRYEYYDTGTYYFARQRTQNIGVYLRNDGKFYLYINEIFTTETQINYMCYFRTYKINCRLIHCNV